MSLPTLEDQLELSKKYFFKILKSKNDFIDKMLKTSQKDRENSKDYIFYLQGEINHLQQLIIDKENKHV
tara:strand:- start:83 stop:289 length:207 start_codon:yes stop_codon:yes gene_type:complete